MPNKMLIDSTHPEETRVVVLRGNRVEEFDFESANRKQLRGNIYLAKVTRVEPSLQAAFVDYGGNRHGFLAFSEIHPDYYQIPVADRQALIDEEERQQRAADAEADSRAGRRAQRERRPMRSSDSIRSEPVDQPHYDGEAMVAASEVMAPQAGSTEDAANHSASMSDGHPHDEHAHEHEHAESHRPDGPHDPHGDEAPLVDSAHSESGTTADAVSQHDDQHHDDQHVESHADAGEPHAAADNGTQADAEAGHAEHTGNGNITEVNGNGAGSEDEVIESVGGADAMEEVPERMPRSRRQYKIQEVIKRRQVMLVQVVKEERGTKGAALTTYLSLAGRYSVLMPNTARGGGISRKITSAEDRRRLKDIAQELEVPEGMGVILRTAGASRTKTEVKRDFEYLLRLWETVRDLTLKSTAPMLVYEEGSLIKRSIRDLYNKDIDEILVSGEAGYQEAKDFMRMLMPSHAKSVKPFRDGLPIFTRAGIESQLDAMFQPVVQLRSGGYIVLNQAEALVAIDVNSGRATREHHIEDTALKTNCEAAEEIARQLRLRDLAGLIVIDFIDMDEKRNNRTVERRLKEALRHDRARIQVGHISHFGLLEMSRQRIRSSVLESSTEKCPHCGGTGHVRSVSSVALQLLRGLEEMLLKGATHNLIVRTRTDVALYLLNQKRAHLRTLEERFQIAIIVNADATIGGQTSYLIEKGELVHSLEQAKAIAAQPSNAVPAMPEEGDDVEIEEPVEEEEEVPQPAAEAAPAEEVLSNGEALNGNGRGRRRRRRGRGGGEARENGSFAPREAATPMAAEPGTIDAEGVGETTETAAEVGPDSDAGASAGEPRGEGERRNRRRGRRGGRRNRRDGEPARSAHASDAVPEFESEPGSPETTAQPYGEQPHEEPRVEASHQPQAEHVERTPQPPQPEAQPPAPAPAPSPAPIEAESKEPEPAPRRRSTIRERAPVAAASEADAVPSAPVTPPTVEPVVISTTAADEAERPRRAGWWSRRVLGKG